MKIRSIYWGKGIPVVSIMLALLCIVTTAVSAIMPSISESLMFMYPIRNPWQFITYVFQHYTPQSHISSSINTTAIQFSAGHLAFNLLLVLPFGVMVEKVIGSKKTFILMLVAWILDVSAIYLVAAFFAPKDAIVAGHGASGLAFSLMPVGVYILLVLGKRYGFGKLFKQISFYLLMPIAIITLVFALSPSIAGVTEITSMMLHLIAVVAGVVFVIIYHKTIRGYFDKVEKDEV